MEAGKQELIESINEFSFQKMDAGAWCLHRFDADVPVINPVEWLNGQPATNRTYVSTADRSIQTAGIGSAYVWDALPELDALVVSKMPCFYLKPFDDHTSPHGKWGSFLKPRAFVPLIEYTSTGKLVANLICGPDEDLQVKRNQLIDAVEAVMPIKAVEASSGRWTERHDQPTLESWKQAMETILGMINKGALKKAVIARETILSFNDQVNPLYVLQQLIDDAPGVNHFLFTNDEGATFLGATPELLFKRNGCEVTSQAVAATRKRGVSDDDDQRLELEILNSRKECYEHQLVADMLEERMKPLCSDTVRTPVTIMKLPRLQHLFCEISGRLNDEYSDQDLIGILHPSPAVGGVPREVALPILHELEGFQRGCYSAPIGCVVGDRAQVLVAIRSALIAGDTLHTYAGAGIVDGSEAQAEWNEVESKIGGIRGIFCNE